MHRVLLCVSAAWTTATFVTMLLVLRHSKWSLLHAYPLLGLGCYIVFLASFVVIPAVVILGISGVAAHRVHPRDLAITLVLNGISVVVLVVAFFS